MTPHQRARALLTKWSEQEGCTVISRYEGDRWDKLVDLIAAALEAETEATITSVIVELKVAGLWDDSHAAAIHTARQRKGAR